MEIPQLFEGLQKWTVRKPPKPIEDLNLEKSRHQNCHLNHYLNSEATRQSFQLEAKAMETRTMRLLQTQRTQVPQL